MTDYVSPTWTWDEEAMAGYIDFDPESKSRRFNSRPFKKGGVTFIIDRDGRGDTVGIEILG